MKKRTLADLCQQIETEEQTVPKDDIEEINSSENGEEQDGEKADEDDDDAPQIVRQRSQTINNEEHLLIPKFQKCRSSQNFLITNLCLGFSISTSKSK